MSAPPHEEAVLAGQKGGLARTPKKLAALRRLHAARRGLRQRPDSRERGTVLAHVLATVRDPEPGRSIRAAAGAVGVSDRTLRRWLDGTDWPPPTALRAIQRWLREISGA